MLLQTLCVPDDGHSKPKHLTRASVCCAKTRIAPRVMINKRALVSPIDSASPLFWEVRTKINLILNLFISSSSQGLIRILVLLETKHGTCSDW
jgi:hypothetical protein